MLKPLDFSKVEAIRMHMRLTNKQMAQLFDVTPVTYHGWVAGKPLRPANLHRVRLMLRALLIVVNEHNWPTEEVLAMTMKNRFAALLKLLP